MTARAGAALARQKDGTGNTLTQMIRDMEGEFRLAMPRGGEATQLIRDALTLLRATPRLGDCEPMTVMGALMTCAQLNLRPGVLGHAWVLPFRDNKSGTYKAQLVIGYQGYIELAMRSPQVSSVVARTAFEGDEFRVEYGTDDQIIHRPDLDRETEGTPGAYYAVVKYVGGGHSFFVMTKPEMERWRSRHAKSKDRGPWVDDFEAMAWKTCVRRLAKWMPKSADLALAVSADESVRVDLASDASFEPAEPDVVEATVQQPAEEWPQVTKPGGES